MTASGVPPCWSAIAVDFTIVGVVDPHARDVHNAIREASGQTRSARPLRHGLGDRARRQLHHSPAARPGARSATSTAGGVAHRHGPDHGRRRQRRALRGCRPRSTANVDADPRNNEAYRPCDRRPHPGRRPRRGHAEFLFRRNGEPFEFRSQPAIVRRAVHRTTSPLELAAAISAASIVRRNRLGDRRRCRACTGTGTRRSYCTRCAVGTLAAGEDAGPSWSSGRGAGIGTYRSFNPARARRGDRPATPVNEPAGPRHHGRSMAWTCSCSRPPGRRQRPRRPGGRPAAWDCARIERPPARDQLRCSISPCPRPCASRASPTPFRRRAAAAIIDAQRLQCALTFDGRTGPARSCQHQLIFVDRRCRRGRTR